MSESFLIEFHPQTLNPIAWLTSYHEVKKYIKLFSILITFMVKQCSLATLSQNGLSYVMPSIFSDLSLSRKERQIKIHDVHWITKKIQGTSKAWTAMSGLEMWANENWAVENLARRPRHEADLISSSTNSLQEGHHRDSLQLSVLERCPSYREST